MVGGPRTVLMGAAVVREHPSATVVRSSRGRWIVAFTVTLATFMEILDTSIANVSLPHIAGGLSASVDESTWVLTSYLVANAIVLPISGWMAGMIGRKRFYMLCVALFTISSLCCGLAPNLGMLVFFRVLQGAGGGGLQPSEQSILADTFPREEFGMAFAIYGMAIVLAPAIGPTLGGFITDHFSWRWIFFINLPVGVISLLLTNVVVEDPPYLKEQTSLARRGGVDFTGLVLIALGLGAMQIVLDRGQEDDWLQSHFMLALTAISAVALVCFVLYEIRQKRPVVDLHLLRNSNFAITNAMMFSVGIVLYGSTVLIPQYLQGLMGYSAQLAGMALSPGGFAIIVLMPMMGMMMKKVQARWLIMIGFLISAAAFYHMSNITTAVDFRTAMMYRVYQSAGLAFLFVPITTVAYIGIDPEKSREVSSMINLSRNIGASVGISVVETMLVRRSQFHQSRMVEGLNQLAPMFRNRATDMGARLLHQPLGSGLIPPQVYAQIYGAVRMQAAAEAYVDVIWLMMIVAIVMAPFALLLRHNDPAHTQMGVH
jgi:MFS transporter, DHA2 family, multidrug resistance protein